MAPSNTPARKRRENSTVYFEPGVMGRFAVMPAQERYRQQLTRLSRRTGVTLKNLGARDENGLEPLEGIFSSPEKSPPKPKAWKVDTTLTSSEAMEVAQSGLPNTSDMIHAHQLLSGNRLHPRSVGRAHRSTATCCGQDSSPAA